MAKLLNDKTNVNKLFSLIALKGKYIIDPDLNNHLLNSSEVANVVDIDKYRNAVNQIYNDFKSNLDAYILKYKKDPEGIRRIAKKLDKLKTKFKAEKLNYETSGVLNELKTEFESTLVEAENQNKTNAWIFSRNTVKFNLEVANFNIGLITKGMTDLEKLAEDNGVNLNEKLIDASIIERLDDVGKNKKSVDKLSKDCKHKDIIAEVLNNPKYQFKIRNTSNKKNADVEHLKTVHQHLKEAGFINCRPMDFVRVFDDKNPKPIQWLESCTLLFYFIQKMDERFDLCPGNISVYKVAVKFFLNKNNEYFRPHRFAKDDDPNVRDKDIINGIMKLIPSDTQKTRKPLL